MPTAYLSPSRLQELTDVSVNPGSGQNGYPLVWNNTAGKWEASNTFTGTLTGSATSLATGRTISATGDISWTSGAFNGTANVTGVATIANNAVGTAKLTDTGVTAGTYTNSSVTVDAKGRVTAASSGTAPVTSFSGGTTGLTPASATSGSVTLAGTLGLANGGTNATTDTAARANLKIPEYTISRGQNLVSNGFGTMGTNYNFSSCTFNGADTYFSGGSFRGTTNVTNDEFIPVDVNKRYILAHALKQSGNVPFFCGLVFFDVDKLSIPAPYHMYISNTLTRLATPLNPGDTVINLVSSANWITNTSAAFQRSIIFWNYKNSFGGAYPPESNPYSRFSYIDYTNGLWANNNGQPNVGIQNNTIYLNTPWAGPSFPVNTQCSNNSDGGSFKYITLGGGVPGNTFTVYSGAIQGLDLSGQNVETRFPPGTAYCKVLIIPNSTTTFDLSSISFGEDYSALPRYTPTSTADSANTTSGSIVTPGGVGIAKSLIVGGSRVNLANLPTTEPATVGDLWRDGNVIKVKT